MFGKRKILLAASVLLAVAAPATNGFAVEQKNVVAGEPAAERLLVLMDMDKSGTVTRQEFMNFMEKTFARLDIDKNGELYVEELRHLRLRDITPGGDQVKQLVLLMDEDKNGRVSKHEFMHFMELEFARLDTDSNNELESKELKQMQVAPDWVGPPFMW